MRTMTTPLEAATEHKKQQEEPDNNRQTIAKPTEGPQNPTQNGG